MDTTTHDTRPAPGGAAPPRRRTRWPLGHLLWLATAVAALLAAGAMAATAGVVHHVEEQHRDGDYLTTDTTGLRSDGYAVVVDDIDLDGLGGDWLLGTARLRVTSTGPGSPVFVGVAPSADVTAYLRGAGYSTVADIDAGTATYDDHTGGAPGLAPDDSDIWVARDSGAGTRTVTWTPEDGSWAVVVMSQDASAGVEVEADLGATVPILDRAVRWLLLGSVVSGLGGVAALALLRVSRRRREGGGS